ncbi:hypothetical protein RB195_010392 [Necator americanus]|uniref:Secreted protein n=1 Tax=Necator americanus TaxID=51031 RepID=A0ABR1CYH8_NECAM
MTNRTYFRHFVAALAPGYALSTVAMVNMCQRDKSSSRNSVLRTEGAREVVCELFASARPISFRYVSLAAKET